MGRIRIYKQEGFTLVELLITVLIIGLLAAIAIPVFNGQRAKAYDARTVSNLTNAVRTFKDVYLPKDQYNQTGLNEAAVNETALNISNIELSTLPESEAYKENIIQARMFTADPHTVVLTQKSRSGKDFCVATREMTPFAGVVRSWTIPTPSTPGSLTGLAGLCPSTDRLATLGSTYHHEFDINALVPIDEDEDEGGSGGGGGTEPPASYGDYFDIRATISPTASCGFDDNGTNNSNNSLTCTGGVSGQYASHNNTDYELMKPSGILGLTGEGDPEPVTGKYSALFKGISRSNALWNIPSPSSSGGANVIWSTELWIKPETNNANQGILGTYDKWYLALNNGKALISVNSRQVNPSDWTFTRKSLTGDTNLQVGEWNQIVATWNNGTLTLYTNGKLDKTSTEMGKELDGHGGLPSLGLGYINGESSMASFNGGLDEFSFYHKELTAAEIKALYEAGAQKSVE